MGSIENKRILDIACGSGRKALEWAQNGASEVYAFDISDAFIIELKKIKPENMQVFKGDIADISGITELQGQKFDLITSLMAAGYPDELTLTFKAIRNLQNPNGRFVLAVAHPFRWVIEKMEKGLAPGLAYREEYSHSYPSTWDNSVTTTQNTFMLSTRINSLLESGFALEKVIEPCLTDVQRDKYPHKAEWADKYFGTIIFVARAV